MRSTLIKTVWKRLYYIYRAQSERETLDRLKKQIQSHRMEIIYEIQQNTNDTIEEFAEKLDF